MEADLPQYQVPPHYRDGVTGVQLPPDLPFYVRAYRLQEAGDAARNGGRDVWLRDGTVVSVDCFAVGVQVHMRFKNGKVTVFTEDSEGTEEVGTWE